MKTAHSPRYRLCSLVAASVLVLSASPASAETPLFPEQPFQVVAACAQCGVVENIREISREGESTGLGTVAGGLIGGLLGRQLAEDGSILGMLIGMAGGAYAGNKFEQYRNRASSYEVTVRMDDGAQRTLTFDSRPVWRVGERVRFGSGGLAPLARQPERAPEDSRI